MSADVENRCCYVARYTSERAMFNASRLIAELLVACDEVEDWTIEQCRPSNLPYEYEPYYSLSGSVITCPDMDLRALMDALESHLCLQMGFVSCSRGAIAVAVEVETDGNEDFEWALETLLPAPRMYCRDQFVREPRL